MSKKRDKESKKARKKRCDTSYSKRKGAYIQKALSEGKVAQRMPETFKEVEAMGILR